MIPVNDRTAATVIPKIEEYILPRTIISSDKWTPIIRSHLQTPNTSTLTIASIL